MNKTTNGGFSLAVLAVLVVVFSATTIGLMTYGTTQPIMNKKVKDVDNINNIIQYIKNYAVVNNVIPCPADPTLTKSDANYLKAAGNYPACNSSLPKDTDVYKGLVPTRTLGINDQYATDMYQGMLTYMMSAGTGYFRINIDGSCVSKTGDTSGCATSAFESFASGKEPNIVIISHGANQIGAFKKDLTSVTAFSKTEHQIWPTKLPNSKNYDSLQQAMNHDIYLAANLDRVIFKPSVPVGHPLTGSTMQIVNYDDTVQYAKIEVTSDTGTLQCWGRTTDGQTTIPGGLGKVKAVSCGDVHTCVIKADDTVQCWGSNSLNQATVPGTVTTATAVSSGFMGTCAIKTGGTVVCWGTTYPGTPPADTTGAKAIALSVGGYHACVIKSDNTVKCWGGSNTYGQLTTPGTLGTVKAIAVGYYHNCAIKTDNTMQCWGENSYSQATIPADVTTVQNISVGSFHTCAVKMDGTLKCWGGNTDGQTTIPGTVVTSKYSSGGNIHTCATKADGTVACWGKNQFNKITVPGTLGAVKALSSGTDHNCAIKVN